MPSGCRAARSTGRLRQGVAYREVQDPIAEAPADRDLATRGRRLDAVVYRVLDQRLQQQLRHLRLHWQPVQVPYDAQAVAEALALDAQIAARELQLLGQGRHRRGIRQGGAEQVREVLHDLFRELGIDPGQAGDGVHAVEQEVRPDAGLQCLQTRLRLGQLVLADTVLFVQVAQQHGADDRGDRQVVYIGRQGVVATAHAELFGREEHQALHREDQQPGDEPSGGMRQTPERYAQRAIQAGHAQCHPLDVQRAQAELAPETPRGRGVGQGQDDGQQLGAHDDRENRPDGTEIRQEGATRDGLHAAQYRKSMPRGRVLGCCRVPRVNIITAL